VFLATLGTPADFTVRATWMTNLLASGGIEAVAGPLQDFQSSALEPLPVSARLMRSTRPKQKQPPEPCRNWAQAHVMMAGKPGNIEKLLSAAGVGEFVHAGQNVVSLLEQLQLKIGVNKVESES
jgi:methylmalonyl-CoA mutase